MAATFQNDNNSEIKQTNSKSEANSNSNNEENFTESIEEGISIIPIHLFLVSSNNFFIKLS